MHSQSDSRVSSWILMFHQPRQQNSYNDQKHYRSVGCRIVVDSVFRTAKWFKTIQCHCFQSIVLISVKIFLSFSPECTIASFVMCTGKGQCVRTLFVSKSVVSKMHSMRCHLSQRGLCVFLKAQCVRFICFSVYCTELLCMPLLL